MNEHKRNVLVGLFMLAGLAMLGVLLVLFGEKPAWLGGAEYELTITFREVEGVADGMPVNLNGVQVGRVERLEFNDPQRPALGLRVIALIQDRYYIPTGATGRVYANLLGVGRGRIEIIVPEVETEPLDWTGAVIAGEMGNPFEELIPEDLMFSLEKSIRQIGNLFETATPVADDLHQLFAFRRLEDLDDPVAEAQRITANLSTVVQRFDKTLAHFNQVLGDPEFRSAIVGAVENLEGMTAEGKETFRLLRETASEVQQDLNHIAGALDALVADTHTGVTDVRKRLIPALESVSKLADNLNRASRELAEGEGTAGLFLRDPRLYEAMLLSLERLTDALDKLRSLFDQFDAKGRIDLKIHEAVGPLPVDKSIPIRNPQ